MDNCWSLVGDHEARGKDEVEYAAMTNFRRLGKGLCNRTSHQAAK